MNLFIGTFNFGLKMLIDTSPPPLCGHGIEEKAGIDTNAKFLTLQTTQKHTTNFSQTIPCTMRYRAKCIIESFYRPSLNLPIKTMLPWPFQIIFTRAWHRTSMATEGRDSINIQGGSTWAFLLKSWEEIHLYTLSTFTTMWEDYGISAFGDKVKVCYLL